MHTLRIAQALLAVGLCLWTADLSAETVCLKAGLRLTGTILEQSKTRLRLQTSDEHGNSVVLTIDIQRIDRIEPARTFAERIEDARGLFEAGDASGAEARFRELMHELPLDARPRVGLALALVALERPVEARKTLEAYLELVRRDRDPELLLELAALLVAEGDTREARKLAREAAKNAATDEMKQRADLYEEYIDRLRSGEEQRAVAEAARKEEIERRLKERAAFDESRGNCLDAVLASGLLLEWAEGAGPGVAPAMHIELSAPGKASGAYARGGDEKPFRDAVTAVKARVTVSEAAWKALFDHQKDLLVWGWFWQLRARYPQTSPVIEVVCPGNKSKETVLAVGTWNGRKRAVVVDRKTPPNIDQNRLSRLPSKG